MQIVVMWDLFDTVRKERRRYRTVAAPEIAPRAGARSEYYIVPIQVHVINTTTSASRVG